jgi:hypothetical protein
MCFQNCPRQKINQCRMKGRRDDGHVSEGSPHYTHNCGALVVSVSGASRRRWRGIMSGQIPLPMGSIALVATLLVWSVSVGAPTITARADDCLAEPNSPAPAGSHWYYHLDRATQRKCWYIRATDQPAPDAAAQATLIQRPCHIHPPIHWKSLHLHLLAPRYQ